jgi:outer membrane protein
VIRSLIRLLPLFLVLPSAAQTLPELADRALAADPAVRATGASLRAAEERLFQARAAYGPTANLTATTTDALSRGTSR